MSETLAPLHAAWHTAVDQIRGWAAAAINRRTSTEKQAIYELQDPDHTNKNAWHAVCVEVNRNHALAGEWIVDSISTAMAQAATGAKTWANSTRSQLEDVRKMAALVDIGWSFIALQVNAIVDNIVDLGMKDIRAQMNEEEELAISVSTENEVKIASMLANETKKCSDNVANMCNMSIKATQFLTIPAEIPSISRDLKQVVDTVCDDIKRLEMAPQKIAPFLHRVSVPKENKSHE
jgi:hypothetical protein